RTPGRRARRQPAAYSATSTATPRSTVGSNDHEVSGDTSRHYAPRGHPPVDGSTNAWRRTRLIRSRTSILPRQGGRSMRIEVKGRNLPVSEDLREHVAKRFRKVERQVSELAELEVEVFEERNPAIADSQVAEATLHLK